MNAIGKTFRAVNTRDGAPAIKTLVCRYPGHQYVAEREDDELCVYKISGEHEATGATMTGDKRRTSDTRSEPHITPAKLQAINEQFRERNVGFFDKGCGGHRR